MPTLVAWNHASTVGVEAVDSEHAIMIDAMNELRLALASGAERVQANELLGRLIEITRIHFRNEELLMERYGYPGVAEHRKEHQRLITQLVESTRRLQNAEHGSMNDLLCFLHDWFIDHVLEWDHQYVPWLNERGVY
ncbi:MAG: hemerythrin family protein [Terracidiphilus sp.]|jgi:hemerythrin-like metal-binding protein